MILRFARSSDRASGSAALQEGSVQTASFHQVHQNLHVLQLTAWRPQQFIYTLWLL